MLRAFINASQAGKGVGGGKGVEKPGGKPIQESMKRSSPEQQRCRVKVSTQPWVV